MYCSEWERMFRRAVLCAGCIALFGVMACSEDERAASGAADDVGAIDGASDAISERGDVAVDDIAVGDANPPAPSDDVVDSDTPPVVSKLELRDLPYSLPPGTSSDLATLDLFRIDDGETRPVVVLVHGGSWASGDKSGYEQRIVPWFLNQGYVAAPVNFRLATKVGESPPVKPLDQARDIASAVAWLVDNADTYGIDAQRIILLGYSSGAHLVALLGTDERFLSDVGVEPSRVKGVISLDVHAYDVPYALELMVGSVVDQNQGIIRHLFGDTEAQQLEGSPITYVDGWAAPALIVSVDADPAVEGTHGYIVAKAASRYVAALQDAGHQAETIHDITETHATLVNEFGAPGDLTTETIQTFLSELAQGW